MILEKRAGRLQRLKQLFPSLVWIQCYKEGWVAFSGSHYSEEFSMVWSVGESLMDMAINMNSVTVLSKKAKKIIIVDQQVYKELQKQAVLEML